MTRHELNTELKKLDRYIEVQQIFTTKTLCCGIANIQNKFNDDNIQMLKQFIDTREILKALEKENDSALQNIQYKPIRYHET